MRQRVEQSRRSVEVQSDSEGTPGSGCRRPAAASLSDGLALKSLLTDDVDAGSVLRRHRTGECDRILRREARHDVVLRRAIANAAALESLGERE
jgi:hypothetical protein